MPSWEDTKKRFDHICDFKVGWGGEESYPANPIVLLAIRDILTTMYEKGLMPPSITISYERRISLTWGEPPQRKFVMRYDNDGTFSYAFYDNAKFLPGEDNDPEVLDRLMSYMKQFKDNEQDKHHSETLEQV